jgi:hypothetical protein
MKSPIKIPPSGALSIQTQLYEFLEAKLNLYYKQNKDLIEDYQYIKSKLEELEYRLNPQYRLTITNNKNSGKVINAKLKLPFIQKENSKSKYPFFNIHIGKLADYKEGLEDPQLRSDALKKVKLFIDTKFPFSILSIDNQLVEYHYETI